MAILNKMEKISAKKTEWYKRFEKDAIFIGYRGSTVHGTYRPSKDPEMSSDKDAIVVVAKPLDWYLGFYEKQDTWEIVEGEWDVVVYEFKKFFQLLCKSNPNVLSTLWYKENDIILTTKHWRNLVAYRDIFVSKEAYNSFSEYAHAQFERMVNGKTDGTMGEKRKLLVEKFGYNTKHACALIMLLNQCIEFLSTGSIQVKRPESAYLLSIKDGNYTLDEMKVQAQKLFDLSKSALISSKLKDSIDRKSAENVFIDILKEKLNVMFIHEQDCSSLESQWPCLCNAKTVKEKR